MAKTAKIKKRQSTLHSRAARRAHSPSPDSSLSKPLKPSTTTRSASASPPPNAADPKPHVLAAQNAGITKKSKSKPLKRAQRLRRMKGMERAADNMDKLELKVARSVGKEKKVNERRKGKEREWVSDEEMDGVDEEVLAPDVAGEVKQLEVVVPASVPLPVATEEDEFL
ncbi:hypothetical protein BU26DRAFT_252179 [Trematosphaeria pertusa]|uniref:Ribosome biogenesis protein Alb1 n=1 Tax=Trematosphaeria pertusa TaxID=390896 RepID=A0A6A6IP31_9PLEO|nr:uncharacterized protein BU26DRAFT_252179 [Trematosphaeria pertusa]KAF2252156.1 hypothetical protein BU26DRAFT_252179 [Trematosphaeria pertusa]